ncbi:MAG: response regulator [bacterium]|nr:response regulator [bacterium]
MTRRIDVLVVEDEPVVVAAARKILREDDLEVVTANDVNEACEILRDTRCRLVLSDLKLPGASGFDLLELIQDRWPDIEVVVITGYATLDNALMTFRKGGFDFVAKPFDIGELLGVVRRALEFSDKKLGTAPGTAGSGIGAVPGAPSYFLGRHSWARLDSDGSATLGLAETFPDLLGEIETIELLEPEQRTMQGRLLARILTPGEIVHRVRSPLSGIVLTANPLIRDSIELINRDPFGKGWLTRIIPDNLDRELDFLDQRWLQME